MKIRKTLLVIILLCSQVFATSNPPRLAATDVRKMMHQLFEYHVDHKELSQEVIQRSLKIYVTQFDPGHSYLLEEEVKNYLHPSSQFLASISQDYEKDNYQHYFTLNQTICQGIERARKWREQWATDPVKLIAEAKQHKDVKIDNVKFLSSVKDLKKRHYHRFLSYLNFLMEDLGHSSYEGLEQKIVTLAERQLSVFENNYLGMNETGSLASASEQEHQVLLRTMKAFAHSLDAHTAYFSPDEAYAMKVQLEKGMCGIGVVLREGIDGVMIHELIKGGPAEKSGSLLPGDTIVEVDGKTTKEASFKYVLDIMRGKEGSKTTLGVVRSADKSFARVSLTRAKIALEEQRLDVSTEKFGDGVIGKLTLHSFYEGENGISSEQDIKKAIQKFKDQGPLYGLVLDMRDNSGGFLSQAIKVSGLFMSSGVVVISKYSDGTVKYYRSLDSQRVFDGPLVILVSKGSASATEIVAQTLQDYGIALVVGDEKTYGKGTIQHQTVTDNSSHSFFKVTIGRYYTVSGRSTQIDGVRADMVIPTDLHFTEIGENHLEYPLPADKVEAAFEDPLTDVDPFAKKWFTKHYTPYLQQRQTIWIEHLPVLQENSQNRIKHNKNFQIFLSDLKDKKARRDSACGGNDLQMEESVNILKDMLFLSK